jgi:predicted protein tyrosine phosphatase
MNKIKPKILCICSMGLNRSKWVANYLEEKGYETRYGGIGPCRIDPEPANPIKEGDLDWANIIIVARSKHKIILEEKHKIKDKRIIVLEVSDSRYKAYLKKPEWENISQEEYNRLWTYPKLKEALEPHLPLEKYF